MLGKLTFLFFFFFFFFKEKILKFFKPNPCASMKKDTKRKFVKKKKVTGCHGNGDHFELKPQQKAEKVLMEKIYRSFMVRRIRSQLIFVQSR